MAQKSLRVLNLLRVLSDSVLFRFLSDWALFKFLSDRVLFMVLSDRALFQSSVVCSSEGSSVIDSSLGLLVLLFRCVGTFLSKSATTFFIKTDVLFYIIFSKRCLFLTIRLTCFDEFQQNG